MSWTTKYFTFQRNLTPKESFAKLLLSDGGALIILVVGITRATEITIKQTENHVQSCRAAYVSRTLKVCAKNIGPLNCSQTI